jgi:hypothetical protein
MIATNDTLFDKIVRFNQQHYFSSWYLYAYKKANLPCHNYLSSIAYRMYPSNMLKLL